MESACAKLENSTSTFSIITIGNTRMALVFLLICVICTRKILRSLSAAQEPLDFGPWAVVTGATDGIGKEYAIQLAATGTNIVLISRSATKLAELSHHLVHSFGIRVRTIVADFSQGIEIYSKIQLGLEGLEVGTLVNNVGTTYPSPRYLHELDDGDCVKILNCNILSNVMMTKMLLPSMVGRGGGVIINLGSLACQVPFPFLSLYAATKTFVDKLSQDLALEFGSKGITIQSLVPACVATKMSHIQETSFFAPNPAMFVESAISYLRHGRTRTPGYFSHSIQQVWFKVWGAAFPSHYRKYNYSVMHKWRRVSYGRGRTSCRA